MKTSKKGAFGGTGTGRGMRGMPGRKLIKKTVKAGWKAHNRVTLSTKPVKVQNHERAMKMTEQAIIREINGGRA